MNWRDKEMHLLRALPHPARALLYRATLGIAAGALLLTASPLAHAHADLLAMIESVSKRIQSDPKNASNYFLRGELYRAHADWKLAEADYNRAAVMNPKLAEIELGRGKLFFETGRKAEARKSLDQYLVSHGKDIDALITRAQLLVSLGEPKAAVADLTQAIENSTTPRPDYFLDRARVQAEQGELVSALKGLDEGIKRLGPLVALQLYAIELDCAREQFDDALKRLEIVANASERKEKWLARRGGILLQASRHEEAKAAFHEASAAIEALPPRLRAAPATVELKLRVDASLKEADQPTKTAARR